MSIKKNQKIKIEVKPTSPSNPIVIMIENLSNKDRKFKLFGRNKFCLKSNFGNHKDIKITTLDGEITYDFIFNKSGVSAFDIGKWRIQSTSFFNLNQKLFRNEIFIFDGKYERTEMNLCTKRDAYQQQSDIIDIHHLWSINSDTYLSGKLNANSNIVISMFPVTSCEMKIGKTEFNIPRLSGLNTTPIIIQSSVTPVKKKVILRKK